MPRTRTYGLDIDTIRYAQRVKSGSGTTILPEPLKQINKFVVGVKKLGLWNSMVCWPMRSIHNAGTGSTVYSLGGLQISNGTMINAPTWQQNGVFFLPNSYINAINYANYPYNTGQFGVSVFSVVNPLGWVLDGTSIDLLLLGNATGPRLHLTNGVGGGNTISLQNYFINYNDSSLGANFINNFTRLYGAFNMNANTLIASYYKNNFFFAGYSPGATAQTCTFAIDSNGTFNGAGIQWVNSFGNTPTTSPIQLRIGSSNVNTNGLISISSLINVPISPEVMQLLRSLYKRTLGIGLNLP